MCHFVIALYILLQYMLISFLITLYIITACLSQLHYLVDTVLMYPRFLNKYENKFG
jgi:energy-coupling factor transporter transmembrane protein EcfT